MMTPDNEICQTDLIRYDSHHRAFENEEQPKTTEDWILRAEKVAEILAEDAAARDLENKSPVAEISLLKSSGLLKVLGPTSYGGGGQTWEVGYQAIREVAKGDGYVVLCRAGSPDVSDSLTLRQQVDWNAPRLSFALEYNGKCRWDQPAARSVARNYYQE